MVVSFSLVVRGLWPFPQAHATFLREFELTEQQVPLLRLQSPERFELRP
jgi:hypothetical protein